MNSFRLFCSFALLSGACNAFSTMPMLPPFKTSAGLVATKASTTNSEDTTAKASTTDEDKAIECFVTNYDLVLEEGEVPEVVCTSEPDDFAWFNGLDRENFTSTEIIKDEAFQECVEAASPRGVPEWECKVDNDWDKKTP